MADNALGDFIRRHREAVTPAEVGLPPGGRRRTPGLRRAELATLAGVSIDYLTRLEQGRDRHPSAPILAALADTLRLAEDDRHLLFHLGARSSSSEFCPRSQPPATTVRPALESLLERLEPTPAAVLNRLGDVVAHTDGWARAFGDVGLADGSPPNLLRHLFADPRARSAYPAWDSVADEAVAALRADSREDDDAYLELVAELGALGGTAFTDRLAAPLSTPSRSGAVRLRHPRVGELRLTVESLAVADAEQRLVVHQPFDEATAEALDRLLLGSTGALRAVPG